MPFTHPRSRRALVAAATLILSLGLAACAASTGSQGPGSQPPASASDLPASLDPGAVIDLGVLTADASRDGQAVRTQGTFLATGDTAQLCAVMLESYPPQCGGASVRIVGEVPTDVLAAMDSTRNEPDLAQATWGFVEVTGTYRATGAGGGPTIELGTIALMPAGG
jgi:hypothetical protein